MSQKGTPDKAYYTTESRARSQDGNLHRPNGQPEAEREEQGKVAHPIFSRLPWYLGRKTMVELNHDGLGCLGAMSFHLDPDMEEITSCNLYLLS